MTRDVYYIRWLDFEKRKEKAPVVVSRCNMRARAQTHAYVCRCRHCCEGYDAGAFVLRSWGVWSENARKEVFAQHGRCVCVEPICIELMVCVCVLVLVGVQI